MGIFDGFPGRSVDSGKTKEAKYEHKPYAVVMPTEQKELQTGALLFGSGDVVPENWNGGYAESFEKTTITVNKKMYWRLLMKGVWPGHTIEVYLDTQEYSGAQADALGEVFRETLNQRRVV
jgi:hypothetical protein